MPEERKNPTLALLLGLLLGPFGYLYFGGAKFAKLVGWLILGTFLIWITAFIAAPFLWLYFGIDCYRIAKNVNRKMESEELLSKQMEDRLKRSENRVIEEKRTEKGEPMELLRMRYARGEISKEEYSEMKKTLEED